MNNNSSIVIIIIPETLYSALLKAENYKVLSIVTHVLAKFYSSLNELSPDEFRSRYYTTLNTVQNCSKIRISVYFVL